MAMVEARARSAAVTLNGNEWVVTTASNPAISKDYTQIREYGPPLAAGG